jgi:hypothetical protein
LGDDFFVAQISNLLYRRLPVGTGVWTFCGLDFLAHFLAHFIDPSGEIMARHRLQRMFALEKLKVYDKALSSAASLAQYSGGWDKRHAVSDHLLRASESIVLNLAEAARLRGAAKRKHQLDYADRLGTGMRRLPGHSQSQATACL